MCKSGILRSPFEYWNDAMSVRDLVRNTNLFQIIILDHDSNYGTLDYDQSKNIAM